MADRVKALKRKRDADVMDVLVEWVRQCVGHRAVGTVGVLVCTVNSWCRLDAQPKQAVRKAPRRPTKAELLAYTQRHEVPVHQRRCKVAILDELVEACDDHSSADDE